MAYIIFSIKTRDCTEHNKIGTNSFRSTKLQLCIFESALKSVKKRKRKNKNPILLGYWAGLLSGLARQDGEAGADTQAPPVIRT